MTCVKSLIYGFKPFGNSHAHLLFDTGLIGVGCIRLSPSGIIIVIREFYNCNTRQSCTLTNGIRPFRKKWAGISIITILHVSYVPIVEKNVYFKKNNKDSNLAGKLKEVIPQISHWKKWPQRMLVERDGKTIQLNSYSLLQDRFYEHMRAAGFEGFERGERGSSADHLTDMEYKVMKESERLAVKSEQLTVANNELTAANEKISTAKEQLTDIKKNLKALKGKVLLRVSGPANRLSLT